MKTPVAFFFFVILFTASFATGAIIIHSDKLYLHSDNETYNISPTMNFSRLTVNDVFIRFNTTSFYITSPNPISILLTFLNSSILNADTNDMLINFTADTSGGKVWFNLSGFTPYANYSVNRSSVHYADMKANGSGFISWNNSLWDSAKSFTVFVKETIAKKLSAFILYVIATLPRYSTIFIFLPSFLFLFLFAIMRKHKIRSEL